MDPIIFEFIGGLLVGAMIFLTVVLKPRRQTNNAMPVLAVRRTGSLSASRRRNNAPKTKKSEKVHTSKPKKKARQKKTSETIESDPMQNVLAVQGLSLESCPSCGLQAPVNLLAEHFLGSPAHRNGPPKMITMENTRHNESSDRVEEEDSKQSVRNLLQILVPPRAFGHRHAQKSVSPITSIVKDPGHARRQF